LKEGKALGSEEDKWLGSGLCSEQRRNALLNFMSYFHLNNVGFEVLTAVVM
jgi:hypothetical protein